MVHTIEEPSVPYVGPIKGGLEPGTMIRVQGKVPEDGDRFNINLRCGAPPSDIALHLSVRLLQDYIARNSFEDGDWGDEENNGSLPIGLGQHFEILILCDPGSYKIAVNGNHFSEFQHRMSFKKVSHLEINGTVALGLIAFESATPAAPPPPPPQYMAGDPDMPPGYVPPPPNNFGYGPPPPQGSFGGGPPQGSFGGGPPPPQGSFGGGPGHYPHNQRDQGEQSGFESFLGTAGSAIATAMVSGLAENLLGGLSGQSQRHTSTPQPQNPAYNQGGHQQGSGSFVEDLLGSLTGGGGQSQRHTSTPQPQNPAYNQGGHQQGSGSFVEDLLGSLTGGGGQSHQRHQPQQYSQNPMNNQGVQQQGGSSTIVSDILGSLASEILRPPRKSQMPIPPHKNLKHSNQPFGGSRPIPFAPPLPPNMYGPAQVHSNPYVPSQSTQMPYLPPNPQQTPYIPPVHQVPYVSPHPSQIPHPLQMPHPPHMPQPPPMHNMPHFPGAVGPPPMPHSYDQHKDKKMRKKMRKAMKYGLPVAGVGVGAYAAHQAMKHHKHHKKDKHRNRSSSSSSSSSSD